MVTKNNILNAVGSFESTHNFAWHCIRLEWLMSPAFVLWTYDDNKPTTSVIQNPT